MWVHTKPQEIATKLKTIKVELFIVDGVILKDHLTRNSQGVPEKPNGPSASTGFSYYHSATSPTESRTHDLWQPYVRISLKPLGFNDISIHCCCMGENPYLLSKCMIKIQSFCCWLCFFLLHYSDCTELFVFLSANSKCCVKFKRVDKC